MSAELATLKVEAPPAPVAEVDPMISMIERAARDHSVDIDKLERLLAMKERMDKAAAVREFNDAVADAKAEIGPIVKRQVVDYTSDKGRTHYKHEDLAEIDRVATPILRKHRLSYRHRSAQNAGKVSVTCILSHGSGHFEETTLEASEDHSGKKNSIQAIGSTATYLQRYTLKLALGLSASKDDDGKAAGAPEPISEEQSIQLRDLIEATETDEKAFCKYLGCERLSALPAKDFKKAMDALKKKAAKV